MLAALHLLAALGGQDGPLSSLVAEYDRSSGSGEINSTVADQARRLAVIKAAYGPREDVTLDELDGLTVSAADWWFNVRPFNTEPLLRLNAEAHDEQTTTRIRDEALRIIRARERPSPAHRPPRRRLLGPIRPLRPPRRTPAAPPSPAVR
jgi:phosphomannomutase